MGVVMVAGAHGLVEDVPVPELAVAAQVELARAESADGHADLFQVLAAIDLAGPAVEERLDPLGIEFLVGRDEFVLFGRLEGTCHDRHCGSRRRPRHPGSAS